MEEVFSRRDIRRVVGISRDRAQEIVLVLHRDVCAVTRVAGEVRDTKGASKDADVIRNHLDFEAIFLGA